MAVPAALILAGDLSSSEVIDNSVFADLLKRRRNDDNLCREICESSIENQRTYISSPVIKTDGSLRPHVYMHPAMNFEWCKLGARLLAHYSCLLDVSSPICFSNQRINSNGLIAREGLFRIGHKEFNLEQKRRLVRTPVLGVLDLKDFFARVTAQQVESCLRIFVSDSKLVSEISDWVAAHAFGLPQGSATSHMIAQFLLTSPDLEIRRLGISHARYVDDFRIFGLTRLEVARDMASCSSILEDHGFLTNPGKTFNHLEDRAACVPLLGGCPGHIPVERYVDPSIDIGQFASEDGIYAVLRHQGIGLLNFRDALDVRGLFADYVSSQSDVKSDAVERTVIRALADIDYVPLRESEQELALTHIGHESLYSKTMRPEGSLEVAEQILQNHQLPQDVAQRRALPFFKRAITCSSSRRQTQRELADLYESNTSPDIDVKICELFQRYPTRYSAVLPMATHGFEGGWPDEAVARLAPVKFLEPSDRNRYFKMASKIRPSLLAAAALLRAS